MSDKKFDDKIRELLDSHEPDVRPDWGRMKERIAAAAAVGAIGIDLAGSKIISQLSIAAAVVAGAVSMWVAQQYVFTDDAPRSVSSEPAVVVDEESDSEASTVYEESEKVLRTDVVTEQDVDLSPNDKSNLVKESDEKALESVVQSDEEVVQSDEEVVHSDEVYPAENADLRLLFLQNKLV